VRSVVFWKISFAKPFPNLRHEEQTVIAQGDMVISIINVTGTHTGNFFILPPTGKNISYEAVHFIGLVKMEK
jgi:predicted ester cyclase